MSKNILITGGDGFVGRHLLSYLENQKFKIFTCDISDGDISCDDISAIFNEDIRIDHVIHLAAKTFVPESWEDPFSFYKTNFMGTINILEFCKKHECSMTYVNTYVYGDPEYLPIDEKHNIAPNTPYNHSKVLAEEACEFYCQYMGLDVTVLRVFNVFGVGQGRRFLIPQIIADVLDSNKSKIEVKNLAPKRDYIYIDDLVKAIALTIGSGDKFNVYNIGTGKSYSVNDIIEIVQSIAETNKPIISTNQVRKNEVMDVYADISKAKKDLGFEPATTLEAGLREIIKTIKCV
ncbi:MAG: GDP-mannose 4,6-dehydratase [Oscillospiraceae bacterium]|nr:GDP-mannose 4,6-dehydratase [Oscillospiraceae bacterium]